MLADKYDVPLLRQSVKASFSDYTAELIPSDFGGLNTLLNKLANPPAEQPAHCYTELMEEVSAVAANEEHIKDLLSAVEVREHLQQYGTLAEAMVDTLEDMLDAEETKMGNINAVFCSVATCPGHRRRWTYKHGPRAGTPRHCLFCGSSAALTNT